MLIRTLSNLPVINSTELTLLCYDRAISEKEDWFKENVELKTEGDGDLKVDNALLNLGKYSATYPALVYI